MALLLLRVKLPRPISIPQDSDRTIESENYRECDVQQQAFW